MKILMLCSNKILIYAGFLSKGKNSIKSHSTAEFTVVSFRIYNNVTYLIWYSNLSRMTKTWNNVLLFVSVMLFVNNKQTELFTLVLMTKLHWTINRKSYWTPRSPRLSPVTLNYTQAGARLGCGFSERNQYKYLKFASCS